MTHQDLRPLFEDPSAPSELRNFVTLARSDGPSQADLERLATRVGRAVGVSAGVLLASSAAGATALGTPPAQLATAVQPGLAKLGVVGKFLASSGGKLLAVGLSAGVGVGIWTYARQEQPAHEARMARRAPAAELPPEPEFPPEPQRGPARPAGDRRAEPEQPGEAREAVAPVPVVTPLSPVPARAAPARSATGRPATRRVASAPQLAAPVNEGPVAAEARVPEPPPAAQERPSELGLIQQAEAARHRGAEALQLLATHERLYPHGALSQERDVLAIELLLKLGKPQQARERAARFERSHPSSAHLPRVRALLQRADEE